MRAGVGANLPVTVTSSATPGGASAAYTLLILLTLVIATMGALTLQKTGALPHLPSFSLARRKEAAQAPAAPSVVANPINSVAGVNPTDMRGSSF